MATWITEYVLQHLCDQMVVLIFEIFFTDLEQSTAIMGERFLNIPNSIRVSMRFCNIPSGLGSACRRDRKKLLLAP